MDHLPNTFISKASRFNEHLQENSQRGKDKVLPICWAKSFLRVLYPFLVTQKESRMKNKTIDSKMAEFQDRQVKRIPYGADRGRLDS